MTKLALQTITLDCQQFATVQDLLELKLASSCKRSFQVANIGDTWSIQARTLAGNKWLKLRDWFGFFFEQGLMPTAGVVITIGSSHSNHLAAFASITYALGLRAIALVRANEVGRRLSATPTLDRLAESGVAVVGVSRSNYRQLRHQLGLYGNDNSQENKQTSALLRQLLTAEGLELFEHDATQRLFFIPEGGLGWRASLSVSRWARLALIPALSEASQIYCAIGTGAWFTGIRHGLSQNSPGSNSPQRLISRPTLIGVPVVRGVNWLPAQLEAQMHQVSQFDSTAHSGDNWRLDWSQSYKGISPMPAPVVQRLAQALQLQIDPVYMPRLLKAMMSSWRSNAAKGSDLILHGGGIQALGSATPSHLRPKSNIEEST